MKKLKIAIAIIAFVLFILVCSTKVDATETFKGENGIVVTKIVEGIGGAVQFEFSNINLSAEENYEWGASKTNLVTGVEKWFTLGEYSTSAKTANISLVPGDKTLLKILRETDTAYLYIKNSKTNSYIVNGLKVNLTLPPIYAFNIKKHRHYDESNRDTNAAFVLSNDADNSNWENIYGITTHYYCFQKITDVTLINAYKQAIINKESLDTLKLANISEAPQKWTLCRESGLYDYYNKIQNQDLPTESGLYYLWIKGKDPNSKAIIGYTLLEIDTDAPTVKAIKVTSPESGTYKTSQTVKIQVEFSEIITGSSVPTLEIKFGESAVRSIRNGVIKNNYIEYSYNIQASDKGQIATVSLKGGEIKDASGNSAKLSCPIISGNTIKANVEGTNNNNTGNQDTNNNPGTNNEGNNQGNNNGTTGGSNSGNNSTTDKKKDDTTIANGNLPKTGVSMIIIMVIVVVIGCGVLGYVKYNSYRDIK